VIEWLRRRRSAVGSSGADQAIGCLPGSRGQDRGQEMGVQVSGVDMGAGRTRAASTGGRPDGIFTGGVAMRGASARDRAITARRRLMCAARSAATGGRAVTGTPRSVRTTHRPVDQRQGEGSRAAGQIDYGDQDTADRKSAMSRGFAHHFKSIGGIVPVCNLQPARG